MSESETPAAMRALALRLINAAETGDLADLADLFDREAVIWHNTDNCTLSMADNMSIVNTFSRTVPRRHYADVRINPFAGGYIQQHRWVCETVAGEKFSVSACAIMHVRNGKIVRVEEYFDSAHITRLGLDTWLPKS
jgi:ketosteroid isomerase-like protein